MLHSNDGRRARACAATQRAAACRATLLYILLLLEYIYNYLFPAFFPRDKVAACGGSVGAASGDVTAAHRAHITLPARTYANSPCAA
ncbi:unnamed protein product [Colias eurytheme]|nr:unnamed protein product [Colias eurytheme]